MVLQGEESSKVQDDFRPNLAGQKGVQIEIAEGQEKKPSDQMGPSRQFFFSGRTPILIHPSLCQATLLTVGLFGYKIGFLLANLPFWTQF